MKKLSIMLVFMLTIFSVEASNLPDFPFVVATGEASREVKPNTAKINIYLLGFNSDSKEALGSVNTASNKIIETLEKYGVALNQLEAHDIKKRTERERGENYKRLGIIGYEVTRTMKLNLVDLSSYSQLMNDLVGINNISQLNAHFDVSNRDGIETELIQTASENAKHKAITMAQGLGTKIDSVYAISQASNFGDFFATFGTYTYGASGFARDGAAPDAKMFVPEFIEVSQKINVVFRIRKN